MTDQDGEPPLNLLSEQGTRVLRTAQRIVLDHVASGSVGDPTLPESLGRYISEALSISMGDIAQHLALLETDEGPEVVISTARLWDFPETRLEDVNDLAAKAKKDGVTSLSPFQVFTLVLVWLVMLSTPIVQQHLPRAVQATLADEVGTVGLAIAITTLIIQRKR